MLRTLTILLFFFLGTVTGFAQNTNLHKDAIQLAARLTAKTLTAEIPRHLISTIENALVVLAASPSPAANAVFYRYNIHPITAVNTYNMQIVVAKNTPWLDQLEQSPIQAILPNSEAASLVKKEETADYILLELTYNKPVNMQLIANEISTLDEVWLVEIPTEKEEKQNVYISPLASGFLFTFVYKFKDCDSGCKKVHYWEFSVDTDGVVSLVNEYGADLEELKEEDYFLKNGEMRS